MNSISPSFFYEHSFEIHLAALLLAATSCFLLINLVRFVILACQSIAAEIRDASLNSMLPGGG